MEIHGKTQVYLFFVRKPGGDGNIGQLQPPARVESCFPRTFKVPAREFYSKPSVLSMHRIRDSSFEEKEGDGWEGESIKSEGSSLFDKC